MKKRPDDTVPWMPAFRYGALLPALSLNFLVRDPEASAKFYRNVFGAEVHYADLDFAAVRVGSTEVMLQADHTHDSHPWHPSLMAGETRGIGAQVRLLGIDPDEVAERAPAQGVAIVEGPQDKGHGWREVLIRDIDGYEWAFGRFIPPASTTMGLQPAPKPAP